MNVQKQLWCDGEENSDGKGFRTANMYNLIENLESHDKNTKIKSRPQLEKSRKAKKSDFFFARQFLGLRQY